MLLYTKLSLQHLSNSAPSCLCVLKSKLGSIYLCFYSLQITSNDLSQQLSWELWCPSYRWRKQTQEKQATWTMLEREIQVEPEFGRSKFLVYFTALYLKSTKLYSHCLTIIISKVPHSLLRAVPCSTGYAVLECHHLPPDPEGQLHKLLGQLSAKVSCGVLRCSEHIYSVVSSS